MAMKKTFLFFLLLLLLPGVATATTLTGVLNKPDGTGVTGTLTLALSQQGAQLSTGGCGGPSVVVPTAIVVIQVVGGAMLGSPSVVGNDCIAPSNTYYVVTLRDAQSNILFRENWTIVGTTINVGSIPPTVVPNGQSNWGTLFVTNLIVNGSSILTNLTNLVSPTISTPTISNPTTTGADSGTETLSNKNIVSPTTSGTDSGTETLNNKSLVSPSLVSPTTTGTDSGTETLGSKTLNGAANGNNVTLLNMQGPVAPITGNSADQTFYTFTIPANTVAAGKCIRVESVSNHSTGTTTVAYKVFLGATGSSGFGYNDAGRVYFTTKICNTTAQSAQTGVIFGTGGVSGVSVAPSLTFSPSENMVNAIVVKYTFNVANTDAITPILFTVELVQ